MGHSVQPGVLDQNIEAVEKRPSGRAATGVDWSSVSDNSLLSVDGSVLNKPMRESDLTHDYVSNGTERAGQALLPPEGTTPSGYGRATLMACDATDMESQVNFWSLIARRCAQ